MTKFKIAVAAVVAVLVVIVIIQNTETVQTRILFVTVEMPRAVLLAITLLLGVVVGLVAALTMSRGTRSKSDDS